ncbi:MAG: acyl carrier protein [Fusobacterium necrophorum]|nr:acyl carrier protein [Fusobacterium necrophorum]
MKNINDKEVELFIKQQLSELLDLDTETIKNDDNLIDYGATSMIIVQLYVALQEEYGVHLGDKLNLYSNHISITQVVDSIRKFGGEYV